MSDLFKKSGYYLIGLVTMTLLISCSESEPEVEEYLLRTSNTLISSEQFFDELDLKKSAYPYNIKNHPDEYNEMVIHLVEVLSEEIILLSFAKDKGIVVSDQELDLAEKEMKKDYPGDSFDQMLLKNAISYEFWKKRFKKNLLMEKLIDQELKEKIEITSQDIIDFYAKLKAGKQPGKKGEESPSLQMSVNDENELVSRLRMQKTQESYGEWIQELLKVYPVQIDKEKLKTFLIDIETSKGNKNG